MSLSAEAAGAAEQAPEGRRRLETAPRGLAQRGQGRTPAGLRTRGFSRAEDSVDRAGRGSGCGGLLRRLPGSCPCPGVRAGSSPPAQFCGRPRTSANTLGGPQGGAPALSPTMRPLPRPRGPRRLLVLNPSAKSVSESLHCPVRRRHVHCRHEDPPRRVRASGGFLSAALTSRRGQVRGHGSARRQTPLLPLEGFCPFPAGRLCLCRCGVVASDPAGPVVCWSYLRGTPPLLGGRHSSRGWVSRGPSVSEVPLAPATPRKRLGPSGKLLPHRG